MLDVLRALLEGPRANDLQPPDALQAVGALLVEAARADGRYDPRQAQAIDHLLAQMFGLGPWEAQAARKAAEAAQAEAADVVRFTRVAKTQLSHADRLRLMEALWTVVLTDGVRDPHEDALLRKLAPLLAVTDRENAEARRRASGEG